KVVSDSIKRAEKDAMLLAQAQQQAKEEEAQRLKDAEEQHKKDSLAVIEKAQHDKAEAERKAKIQADIQAQKEALKKLYSADTSKTASIKPASTAVPKIRESDYQEGITDEKVEESNRTIYRT